MKSVLAVATALVILVIAWFLFAGLLYLIGVIGSQARPGAWTLYFFHVLLMWVLSPAVGSFVAIYTTSGFLRTVPLSTVYVGLVSVIAVVSVLIASFAMVSILSGRATLWSLIVLVLQSGALFIGARMGQTFAAGSRVG